jgi:hypothetical protein
VASAVNWAIFTDLTYSIYFFLPSVFSVFIQRSDVGRAVILNFVQRGADHPKGSALFSWRTNDGLADRYNENDKRANKFSRNDVFALRRAFTSHADAR